METKHRMRIVVLDLGKIVADVLLDEPQALFGAASHCDVRLGPDKVAAEQLWLEVQNGAVYAELRAMEPQVLLNHTPFHSGRLREDSVLNIGTLAIRATVEATLEDGGKRRATGVKPTFVATCVLLVVLLVVALVRLTRHRGVDEAPVAPTLFTGAEPPCPEASGEAALTVAWELLAQADGKRECAPFVPAAGLEAARLYKTAAACLLAAHDPDAAAEVKRRAARMQSFVERDYHLHQVRVHRALSSTDSELLARETKVLAGYLQNDSEYGRWLGRIERDLQVEASARKKLKKKR